MSEPRLRLIKITDGSETTVVDRLIVGRGDARGLVLGPGGSRDHALFSVTAGVASVEDLGSTNGTFINGSPVRERMRLSSGDRIRFDVEEFEFRSESGTEGSAPPAPGAATGNSRSPEAGSRLAVIAVLSLAVTAVALYVAWRFMR